MSVVRKTERITHQERKNLDEAINLTNLGFIDYVQLPLAMLSQVLPAAIFVDPTTRVHCIGVTFIRGLFDGMGIAAVVRVLKAKSLGRPWSIPPFLEPGINESKK